MGIKRKIPRCPYCNNIIAVAVHNKTYMWNPPLFGGNYFSHWEYKKHNCSKNKKQIIKESFISKLLNLFR